MNLWYDKQGRPVNIDQYAQLQKDNKDYYRIAETTLGKIWISTVWLGLDHDYNFSGDGPNPHPIIFETMVFPAELDMERYHTEAEAIAGHKRMVRKWRNPIRRWWRLRHDRS